MVRLKNRHILCEIIFPEDGKKRSVTQKDVAMAITNEIMEMHGDYGIGATRKMPPLQVKYLNSDTNIVMLSAKRGLHKLVQSSLVFVKKIGTEEAFFRTLHLGGTIRSCCKFLIKYHKTQLPLLLQRCTTDAEKERVQAAIIASCQECKKKLQLLDSALT